MKKGVMEYLGLVMFVMLLVGIVIYELTVYGYFSSYVPLLFILVCVIAIFMLAAMMVR